MKKLSKKMMGLVGIFFVLLLVLSLYIVNTPKKITRMEELQAEQEKIDSKPAITVKKESTSSDNIKQTPQQIFDEEEAVYEEIANTSLKVYVYMEQLGKQIIEYHSLYAMDDPEGALRESREITNTITNIKNIADDLDYLPKTSIYIESKRLAIDVINQYYDVASAVMDKKTMMDFKGTNVAYSQSESVDILMAQLVKKLDEEKTMFQKEHGLKE